jgi:hypothetical protein
MGFGGAIFKGKGLKIAVWIDGKQIRRPVFFGGFSLESVSA